MRKELGYSLSASSRALSQSTQIERAFRITLMSGYFRAHWKLHDLVQVDEFAFILQPISRWGSVRGRLLQWLNCLELWDFRTSDSCDQYTPGSRTTPPNKAISPQTQAESNMIGRDSGLPTTTRSALRAENDGTLVRMDVVSALFLYNGPYCCMWRPIRLAEIRMKECRCCSGPSPINTPG
jgi:hypothetical protein